MEKLTTGYLRRLFRTGPGRVAFVLVTTGTGRTFIAPYGTPVPMPGVPLSDVWIEVEI